MAETKTKQDKINLDTEEMTRAGLHFGHRTSKINPKMKPYLFGVRNTVHIIDVEKTKEKLAEALEFIQKTVSEGKVLLLVGTKIQIKDFVKSVAQECSLPYVSERWLGGTFTNFESIAKRVAYYKDLENKKTTGELGKYTKKEQAGFEDELKKLKVKFDGIRDMSRLPDAVFVVDMRDNDLAVREARQKGIAVVGICDTNVDPTLADYPIPASDDSVPSLKYVLEKVKEAVLKAKPSAEAKKEPSLAKSKDDGHKPNQKAKGSN